jgi:Stigma-specific protein, Stig1
MIRSYLASMGALFLLTTTLLAFGCGGETETPSPCADGTTKCGGACVDTKVDLANCGGCGVACASGEVCSAGNCQSECAGTWVPNRRWRPLLARAGGFGVTSARHDERDANTPW